MMLITPIQTSRVIESVRVTLVDMVGEEVRSGVFLTQLMQVEHLAEVDHLVEKVDLGRLERVAFYMVPQDWIFYWVVQEVDWAT